MKLKKRTKELDKWEHQVKVSDWNCYQDKPVEEVIELVEGVLNRLKALLQLGDNVHLRSRWDYDLQAIYETPATEMELEAMEKRAVQTKASREKRKKEKEEEERKVLSHLKKKYE